MRRRPTLIFVPGAWHKPSCYNKIIHLLQSKHAIKCIGVTLPSTQNDPEATSKDDIDAARAAIVAETSLRRDVIVIVHSYGGMVGNSAIKGLTPPKPTAGKPNGQGYVQGLILIASGFTITGLAFMDPFFGHPPPSWRINNDTGYAELTTPPHELFYHDVPAEEADRYIENLTTQSLKALFEGGEHAYAGWMDVPKGNVWYIGSSDDRGMPFVAQRLNVGMARGCGVHVHHVELPSSHSPFISMPDETVGIIVRAVENAAKTSDDSRTTTDRVGSTQTITKINRRPWALWSTPTSWLRFGIPLAIGRMLGWGLSGFLAMRRLWWRG